MISTSGPLWRKLDGQERASEMQARREIERRELMRCRKEKNELVALRLRIRRLRRRLERPTPGTIASILEAVADKHGVTVDGIKTASRNKKLVDARFEACFEITKQTAHTFSTIGRHLGNRDHTTIMHAVKAYAERNGIVAPRGLDGGQCRR
jgi:chromosomal replication initiation ATPase DnaA